MSYEIDSDRRRFLGAAAMVLAATQLDVTTHAEAQTGTTPAPQPPPRKPAMNANTSFASLKQINAGVLNVGYAVADGQETREVGPAITQWALGAFARRANVALGQ